MKLSDTEIEAAVAAVSTSMARTKLERWPDGLLLQLLQLDQLTKLNEHMVALRKFHVGAIDKVADLLELIEKSLPTAPYVPDEEEEAEVAWQAQMNRELAHASIVGPAEAMVVGFADILAKNLRGITPDVVLASHFTEALRAEGLNGYARETARLLSSAGFVFWGRELIGNAAARVWVSKRFQEILRKEEFPEKKIRGYLAEVDFDRQAAYSADQWRKNTGKTPENVPCPPGTLPLGASENCGNERFEFLCDPVTIAPVIDPDHYA